MHTLQCPDDLAEALLDRLADVPQEYLYDALRDAIARAIRDERRRVGAACEHCREMLAALKER